MTYHDGDFRWLFCMGCDGVVKIHFTHSTQPGLCLDGMRCAKCGHGVVEIGEINGSHPLEGLVGWVVDEGAGS